MVKTIYILIYLIVEGSNILEGSLDIPEDIPGVVEGTGRSILAHSAWLEVSNTY
jgi:hypothetical protein